MSETTMPQEILVITGAAGADKSGAEPRRGSAISSLASTLINAQPVNISSLQEQVNIFIQQIDVVMSEAPEKIKSGFHLAEFEVSAGITFEGKGEVKLALVASGEVTGGVKAGLKFIFKRASS